MPSIDEVYAERGRVVLGLAALASRLGWAVGVQEDPAEPDWPVLFVETPEGQLSWHFRREELPAGLPVYETSYDGHTTEEKYARLERVVGSLLEPGGA